MIVDDVFIIKDRGPVIVGHYTDDSIAKVGDEMQIENPDGTVLRVILTGVELINYRCLCHKNSEHKFGFTIRGATRDEIKSGAKIKPMAR